MQAENGGGTIQTSVYDILILLFQIKPLKYEIFVDLEINDVISSMVIFLSTAVTHDTILYRWAQPKTPRPGNMRWKNMPRASFSTCCSCFVSYPKDSCVLSTIYIACWAKYVIYISYIWFRIVKRACKNAVIRKWSHPEVTCSLFFFPNGLCYWHVLLLSVMYFYNIANVLGLAAFGFLCIVTPSIIGGFVAKCSYCWFMKTDFDSGGNHCTNHCQLITI